MFRLIFGKTAGKAKVETQRETITRALSELNGVLTAMSDKPAVRVDLSSGQISIELPEQMPDEALALPKPQVADVAELAPKSDSAENAAPERKTGT